MLTGQSFGPRDESADGDYAATAMRHKTTSTIKQMIFLIKLCNQIITNKDTIYEKFISTRHSIESPYE